MNARPDPFACPDCENPRCPGGYPKMLCHSDAPPPCGYEVGLHPDVQRVTIDHRPVSFEMVEWLARQVQRMRRWDP